MSPRPTLSLIVPVYNEVAALPALWTEIQGEIMSRIPDSEIVAVDDGSRDGSGALLDDLAHGDPRLRVVHQPNGGHGAALLAGLRTAAGSVFFLIDSDRQIPLSNFAAAWKIMEGCDVLLGIRQSRMDPWFRRWLSKLIRRVIGMLFGIRLSDANAPFKLLRREVWDKTSPFIPLGTLAPSLFFAIASARLNTFRLREWPVTHQARTTGACTLHFWKLMGFCGRAFVQLLELRKRLP